MKKNVLLNAAIYVCMLLCLVQVLLILYFTATLVHWHINPDHYAAQNLENNFPNRNIFTYSITEKMAPSETAPVETIPFTLNKIKPLSLYFIYLQTVCILLFTFLALKEFLHVLQSVKSIQSFQKTNITSFRKIGKYLLVVFLVSCFTFVYAELGRYYAFNLNFTPLILMLVAFVMAEIFREGNSLSEENELTV